MSDPWRWRCPHGHVSWEAGASAAGYLCRSCGEAFVELHDAREFVDDDRAGRGPA